MKAAEPEEAPPVSAEEPEAGGAPSRGDWLVGAFPALILLALMTVSFLDVAGRYLFNSPLRGAVELCESMMALLVFSALPLVTARSEHITVDFLDSFIGPRLRRFQAVVVNLASIAMLALLAWRLWIQALDMHKYGSISAFLALPMAPVAGFMSVMTVVTCLILLCQLLRSSGRPEGR